VYPYFEPSDVVIAFLIWIGGLALTLWVSYAVIRAAVRAALLDRYKIVRWYELTGEWATASGPRVPPRDPSAGTTLAAPAVTQVS
jgi:hypothetical protein